MEEGLEGEGGGMVKEEEWLGWGKVEEGLEWEDGWNGGRSKRRKVWSGEMVGVEE